MNLDTLERLVKLHEQLTNSVKRLCEQTPGSNIYANSTPHVKALDDLATAISAAAQQPTRA